MRRAARDKKNYACGPDAKMLPKHSSRLIFSRSFTRVGPSTQRRTDGPPIPRKQPSSSFKAEPASKYRSKHYNPTSTSNDSKPTEKIHLEPHILSRRLIKLCDDRRLDVAVAMLKNSPLDAQNVPVWNTLIWECLKAERYRLGHDLYIDVCFFNSLTELCLLRIMCR